MRGSGLLAYGVSIGALLALSACSSGANTGLSGLDDAGTGGAVTASGGSHGGSGSSGAPGSGGSTGTGGAIGTGGSTTGGATGSGGSSTGGTGTGGTGTGGSSTGGSSTGGSSTGGTGTGGTGTGGSSTGGTGTGGSSTGGTGTGGSSTGGSSTGGTGTGGSGNAGNFGPLSLRGVNLSVAEWGNNVPGTFGVDYTYPDSTYVTGYQSPSYYVGKGMTVFRLQFLWERLQRSLNQPFDAAEQSRLDTTVNHLTGLGAYVILDPHNYARYNGNVIGSSSVPNSAFADLWSRLAQRYGGNSKIIFGLVNEPHDLPNSQWVSAANAAIAAIRATGATNLILVPATGWDNAINWTQNGPALLSISDPGNNYAFEAHNYFNSDASNSDVCISATIGVERLQAFTSWLKSHGFKGFVGEFSGNASSANCQAAVTNMLQHVEDNSDVYLGWAWWAGGPWWGNAFNSVEPRNGSDNSKMAWLTPFL